MPRVRLVSRCSSAGARRTKVFFRLIFRQSWRRDSISRRKWSSVTPFGHGPDDHAAGILGQQLGDHLPQLRPLLPALDLPAHAHLRGVRHVDQESAGQGDLRRHPAPLGADRLLGDLDREGLALLEDVLDVGKRPAGRDLALAAFAAAGRPAVRPALHCLDPGDGGPGLRAIRFVGPRLPPPHRQARPVPRPARARSPHLPRPRRRAPRPRPAPAGPRRGGTRSSPARCPRRRPECRGVPPRPGRGRCRRPCADGRDGPPAARPAGRPPGSPRGFPAGSR